MATEQKLVQKLQKLNNRHKTLSIQHRQFIQHVELVMRQLEDYQGRDVHLPPLVSSLKAALAGANRAAGAAPPTALGRSSGAIPATVPPKRGPIPRQQAGAKPLPGAAARLLPPERLPAAIAALRRGRVALVTRQAQLAACRTCGTDAAAHGEAAAELEHLVFLLTGQ